MLSQVSWRKHRVFGRLCARHEPTAGYEYAAALPCVVLPCARTHPAASPAVACTAGQGANLALVDAWQLAVCVAEHNNERGAGLG